MLSTALPRAGGPRVELPLRIAEVVATVKSRIQEMSRLSLAHEASAITHGLDLLQEPRPCKERAISNLTLPF